MLRFQCFAANDVCTKINSQFNPDVGKDLSALEVYSSLDNVQCRNVHHQTLVRVLKKDFCCAGGHHDQFAQYDWTNDFYGNPLPYSDPHYTSCQSLHDQYTTTPFMYYTDPPTTKKAKGLKKYKYVLVKKTFLKYDMFN